MVLNEALDLVQNKTSTKDSIRACLVTDNISHFKTLTNFWNNQLLVKKNLADIVFETECGIYFIDAKVKDFSIWPAPFLANPNSNLKQWIFFVSSLSDVSNLHTIPNNVTFVDREDFKNKLISIFNKTKQIWSKSFKDVQYLEKIRAFIIHMENDKAYMLMMSDLPEADESTVRKWQISTDKSYFRVDQESGNWFEIPWDDVLYHCEPLYEYYKGKQLNETKEGQFRIGERIRNLRISKGYTIEKLAEKSQMQRPNLSRIEHGKYKPSVDTLERIAEALEVNVAQLIIKNLPKTLG